MLARQETRDLIMVSMAGVGPAGDLDGLPRHGWRSWKAESASDILRLLKTQPHACFAALLDLRGADPRKAGPTQIGSTSSRDRVGQSGELPVGAVSLNTTASQRRRIAYSPK